MMSGVGQPLRIEVPLSQVQLVDGAPPVVRIQAAEASDAALSSRSDIPVQVQVEPHRNGEGHVAIVTSRVPVQRPVVDLRLQLQDAAGQHERRMVVLLPSALHDAVSPVSLARGKVPDTIVVRRGDTLGTIAQRLRSANPDYQRATLYQVLAALLRANPAAFIEGNMHLLRAGERLLVPDAAAAHAIDPAEARRLYAMHMEQFAAYRARLAQGRPVSRLSSRSVATGSIASASPAPPASSGRDVLRLSSAVPAAAAANGTDLQAALAAARAELDRLRDEKVASQRALADAEARVSELEATLSQMQRLLEMQNETLARLQQSASGGGSTSGGGSGAQAGDSAGAVPAIGAAVSTASGSVAAGDTVAQPDVGAAQGNAADVTTRAAQTGAAGGSGQASASGNGAAPAGGERSAAAMSGVQATGSTDSPGVAHVASAATTAQRGAGPVQTANAETGAEIRAAEATSTAAARPSGQEGVVGQEESGTPAASAGSTPAAAQPASSGEAPTQPAATASTETQPASGAAPAGAAASSAAPAGNGAGANKTHTEASAARGAAPAGSGPAEVHVQSGAATPARPDTNGNPSAVQGQSTAPAVAPATDAASWVDAYFWSILVVIVLLVAWVMFVVFRRRPRVNEKLPPLPVDFDLELEPRTGDGKHEGVVTGTGTQAGGQSGTSEASSGGAQGPSSSQIAQDSTQKAPPS